jgi:hypothetical protein
MTLKAPTLLGASIAMLMGTLGASYLWRIPSFATGLLYGTGFGLLFAAFLRWRLPDGCDESTPTLRRRYLREFIPAMAGYVIGLFVSMWLLKRVDEPMLRALIALIPVAPVVFVVRALIRYIRDADELQRQIELESVSLGTALVSMLYLAGGFLQMAKVIDIPSGVAMFWVFPLVCLSYGLVKTVVARRYR